MSGVHVSRFSEPCCGDAREFGGKAAGLAALTAAALPVPPGFAIGVAAYRAFLRGAQGSAGTAARLEATPVPPAAAAAVRRAYTDLCQETGVPDVPVAVRSSATAEDSARASFAGGFDTVLGVTGADDVVAAVHHCWCRVFAAHAVAYARVNGMEPAALEMGVVVQTMVRARAAGVMFTISPVSGDRSRLTIEAGWGLGRAVVGGEVIPDRWAVDKVGLTILERVPGDKRVEYRAGEVPTEVAPARRNRLCLSDDQVISLARLGKHIERVQGGPQDIEFAVESPPSSGDGIVLLQCRTETVWSARPHPPRFAVGAPPTAWITQAITTRR